MVVQNHLSMTTALTFKYGVGGWKNQVHTYNVEKVTGTGRVGNVTGP